MTSPYLIADETVRTMAFALRSLTAGCLDSERERRGAYWDAGIRADDMLSLDAEALRRERTRRRLFGIAFGGVAAVLAAGPAAASTGMEAVDGDLMRDLATAAVLLGIVLVGLIGFFVFVWLARNVVAALRPAPPPRIRRVRDAADEIWS